MVRGMRRAMVAGAAGVLLCAGCAGHARRAPDLSAHAAERPQQKGFLQQTGDAAWNVVSAPVRLVMPGKKAAKPAEEPETYEPAEALIVLPPASRANAAEGAGVSAPGAAPVR